jgi:tuberous sclerosis protein 2
MFYLTLIASRNPDGSTFILPVTKSPTAPSAFLRSLGSLLCRDHTTPTSPLLSTILIDIADNLRDIDTAILLRVMAGQHDLSPTSPDWLANWHSLLGNRTLVSVDRPLTRTAIMEALESVYDGVKDMKGYRRPLADMIWEFCEQSVREVDMYADNGEAMWRILGDEVVLRTVEHDDEEDEGDRDITSTYIDLLLAAASEGDMEEEDNGDTASIATFDTHSPSPSAISGPSTTVGSPILSRTQSEHHSQARDKDKESGLPSVMSILSSLTTGHSSRSHSLQPQTLDEAPDDPVVPPPPPPQEVSSQPRVVAAITALISIFSQLAFTPFALESRNLELAVHVYGIFLKLLADGRSTQARLTVLQFLMHIRADRNHRLYFTHETSSHVTMLSTLINRIPSAATTPGPERTPDEQSPTDTAPDFRKARPRFPQERDGRQLSRGRGTGAPSRSTTSRSRSRAATMQPSTFTFKRQAPLWNVPETFPFSVQDDAPSEGLISYDSEGPSGLVLPVSLYLNTIINILTKERNWEILSYVLCHLPVQLANKHLFCGPKSRDAISKMLNAICSNIVVSHDFAAYIDRWPTGLKARDAQGLVYHTLSVLVSYRRCFDLKQRHLLVEVFQTGLNGQLSTIKCCLHALSLSAFELQPSMTKCLPRILEMLSQIMSNPNMAVHILGFLSVIGSLPPMYANFTEGDFKMVFGVALQFLQHYNRLDASPTTSWALSQHVRILSYSVVYVWFLAVKLQDRPRHIPYITRQLLLANEGNDSVDDPTEVCFDWLARYTYASADPRPAPSVLNHIIMNPPVPSSSQTVLKEKSWVLGHSIITIRTLARRGWIEVLCRRPSGYSKFLCRAENAPMVGAGDVNPDLLSVPAVLIMERDPPEPQAMDDSSEVVSQSVESSQEYVCFHYLSSYSQIDCPY